MSDTSTGKGRGLSLATEPSSPLGGGSEGAAQAVPSAEPGALGYPDAPVTVALHSLRRNALLNLVVRALLAAWALVAAGFAIAYTVGRSGEIVDTLTADSSEPFGVRLLSLSLPAVLLAGLGGLCAFAAWLLYSRGRDDLERGMDCVSRLQREAEVAITARGLTHVFEEKLATARRA